VAEHPRVLRVLVTASRLGEGELWYAVMVGLLLGGASAWTCALQMLCVGGLNLLIYRQIKHRVCRPRPYVKCPEIHACDRALDEFSFPSGHTLHAVSFALLMTFHFPLCAAFLWLFALTVAASRVVLGLHYPSDVAAGALTGAFTASLALLAW
jgi:undecaprenyl-diphosphatase